MSDREQCLKMISWKKYKKWSIFILSTLITNLIIFILVSLYFTGYPIPKFGFSGRESQVFHTETIYQNMLGFHRLPNEVISSYHDDPQMVLIVDPNIAGYRVSIYISDLSTTSNSAQVFFILPSESATENNSRRFMLSHGANHIFIPYAGYSMLRLDLAEAPDIYMAVNTVVFANYIPFTLPLFFVTMMILLLVTFFLYLLIFKPITISNFIKGIGNNKELLLYLLFCFFIYSIWAIVTPLNGAPDEQMRWDLIRFMLETRRLPHGYDPTIRDEIWGFSYAYTPFTTQIIGAFLFRLSLLFSSHPHISLYFARLPSIISSVGTVFFTFYIGSALFTKRAAWFLIILISMWPQFAMVSSYINNDAFALFTIAMILYSWILGLHDNWSIKSCILLAIGIGLCFLSYYNAFTFILFSAPVWILSVLSKKENRGNYKQFIFKVCTMLSIVFVIAGWFYIRNAILYNGDFLGLTTQSMQAEIYSVEHLRPSNRNTFLSEGRGVIYMLTETYFISLSFISFVARFGYMDIIPAPVIHLFYNILMLSGLIGLIILIIQIIKNRSSIIQKKYNLFIVFSMLSIPVTISLHIYHSVAVGFQPQGRYAMPMLLPFCILLVIGLFGLRRCIPCKFNLIVDILVVPTMGMLILLNGFSIFSVFAFYYL